MASVICTIQAGQSISDPVDCSAGAIVNVCMPVLWDAASLSFQASGDGVTYFDVFSNNSEVTVNITPGTIVRLPDDLPVTGKAWLKFRSGTRKGPVVQQGQRQFQIEIV